MQFFYKYFSNSLRTEEKSVFDWHFNWRLIVNRSHNMKLAKWAHKLSRKIHSKSLNIVNCILMGRKFVFSPITGGRYRQVTRHISCKNKKRRHLHVSDVICLSFRLFERLSTSCVGWHATCVSCYHFKFSFGGVLHILLHFNEHHFSTHINCAFRPFYV